MLVCQNLCLTGSFWRVGQIAGTWQLQRCQQSHLVLQRWEQAAGTQSEASLAHCLGEVGSFASQWDLIRPLAAARQESMSLCKISNVWSETRGQTFRVYVIPASPSPRLPFTFHPKAVLNLAQASSALAPMLSPLGLPVVQQWAVLGWHCHNHGPEWACQHLKACVSKLLLSISAHALSWQRVTKM